MSVAMPTWRMAKKTRKPRLQDVMIQVWVRDRPLADAGPLSSPRSGGDSTPSGVETSRTAPVRDPWMPTPSEIESRFGSTAPPSQYALYSCSGIKDDDVTKELDFDPATDQRRDYYIGLFHELRWNGSKKTSRRSRVAEWQALCQSWGAFAEYFNSNPAGYRERIRLAHGRYERLSQRPKINRLHWGVVEAGSPTNLIAQMSSSAAGGCSTLPRAVGDYSSRSSFTPFGGFGRGGLRTPSPFPELPASGRSGSPTYRGSEENLSNEYENDLDLGSGSDDQQYAGQSSELPPVRLAVGGGGGGKTPRVWSARLR
ncbi:unnamed protein product [Phytophthora fragariaefolia]|uniref:Unnamed protein product n=1 Tax=Phytophthora fragariaefolia TaxID=1490495 RepID=A0A9W6TQ04_9STRA|nr:unnamed protein product [Phytophthora fragariaefolia]